MKSINVLKLMNETNQLKEKNRKDTSIEAVKREKVHKFIDTYVTPKLMVLGLSNVNDKAYLDNIATDLILMLSDFGEDESENQVMLRKEEIGFLDSSDTKIKKEIGNRIALYLIKMYTYHDKKEKYIEEYIYPLLEELNNTKKIVFDLQAIDNKTKLETNKINKLVHKFVTDNSKMSIGFDIYLDLYDSEYQEKWNFIFDDNVQNKKDFANIFYDFLIEHYRNINFKDLDNIDFTDYTKAKINIFLKD